MLAVAQERLDQGLILVCERKPPVEWNAEVRALRQTYDPDVWRHASFYDEYLVPADEITA